MAERQAAPIIVDEGFRAAGAGQGQSHLWLQLEGIPSQARFVLLESVWGAGPDALQGMWGKLLPIRNNRVMVYPEWMGPHRDQPFTLGVRARFVFSDNSLSAPSVPVFVTHEGSARSVEGVGPEQIVMALCCLSLLALWLLFRRESDPAQRIRVSAGIALVSLLFLAASPALPWSRVADPSGRLATVDCSLGDESVCATYVPDGGPNPMSLSEPSVERRFELARWVSASSALRIGLILSLVLLMPTLIWLLVVPRLRPAQSAMALGASAAGFTLMAAVFYRLTMPRWLSASTTEAFDLTLLTTANILVAAGMVVYWSFRASLEEPVKLPTAKTL